MEPNAFAIRECGSRSFRQQFNSAVGKRPVVTKITKSMRITKVTVQEFKRFANLTIEGLDVRSKLVVLAGPNGSGKSSLFDAFLSRHRTDSGFGFGGNWSYFERTPAPQPGAASQAANRIVVSLDEETPPGGQTALRRSVFYIRSAYRDEAEFVTSSLTRQSEVTEDQRLVRMIEQDASVAKDYQRLAARSLDYVFDGKHDANTVQSLRQELLAELQQSIEALFPDLRLVGLGNPMSNGTFFFSKGNVANFQYQNLSGGEKAAFDLLLDIVVKRDAFSNSIYCIDEPELHLNTRVQRSLLDELLRLLPGKSQLWLATHSIGMMRRAKDLYYENDGLVTFLDFGERNFDMPTTMTPVRPTRAFWRKQLAVAVDDLADLVVPAQVIVCEGKPLGVGSTKHSEIDAACYNTIFEDEFPDSLFISAGNSNQVVSGTLPLTAAIAALASGIRVIKLIDRDDHAPADVSDFRTKGVRVLSRRHLEAFLFDDSVLEALCINVDHASSLAKLLEAKRKAIEESVQSGKASDDVKSASGGIYIAAKRILGLTGVGNDTLSFMKNTLAKLLNREMSAYKELRRDIFDVVT
jgi:predicted ATPase